MWNRLDEWNAVRSPCRGRCPHRPALGWFISMTRLNGEMSRFYPIPPSHSMYREVPWGFRADVGIGPYIRVGVCTIRRTLHQAHPNPTVSSAKALPGGAGQQKDSYKLKA